MSARIQKIIAAVAAAALIAGLSSCVKVNITKDDLAVKMFKNSDKVSCSEKYYELSDNSRNDTDLWRHGMVSGNGEQGFVTSGSPFYDSMIFQNVHFVMPNRNSLKTPDTSAQLEAVRKAIVDGKDVRDEQSSDGLYAFHPGGALRIDSRITEEKQKLKEYLRYTDYESGEVGVYYTDNIGMWERKSFSSFADNAVFTSISSPSGKRVNITLSFDDPGTIANFGDSNEADCLYKTYVSKNADCIAFIGHYPDYEKSPLRDGGWATVTYVITDGGKKSETVIEREFRSEQNLDDVARGIRIENAYAVYLITVSVRTKDMGSLESFKNNGLFRMVRETRAYESGLAEKYTSEGYFDYSKAFAAHKEIYVEQFNSVELTLGGADNSELNEELIKAQSGSDVLLTSLMQRAYYTARYIQICCSGVSAPRLYGMWTGEFSPGRDSKYTMDASLNLQLSALNTAGIPRSVSGYANFILRQAPDWEKNALATHGFENAIQAPVSFDGDSAALTDSCNDYPFRYYNAGASWLLRPLYETLLTYGETKIPLSGEFSLEDLASVLSLTDEPLSEERIEEIKEKGSLDLRTEILLPLLLKNASYWRQLLTPEYYTDKNGEIHYKKGKEELKDDEYYCIIPSYSPENAPAGASYPAAANAVIDIEACRDGIVMLMSVISESDMEFDDGEYADVFELIDKLPPYLYDEDGSIREWAADGFEDNATHGHLSHLYGVWPLNKAQDDADLRAAAEITLENRKSGDNASHALVHSALIADRLKNSEKLTDILLELEKSAVRYDSMLTNHDTDGLSAYCVDYALGFMGIVNEALIYSEPGLIELLPCVPQSGFGAGSLAGLKTGTQAAVTLMSWDLESKFVIADITSAIDQEIVVKCPISEDSRTLSFSAGETKTVKFDLDPDAEKPAEPDQSEETQPDEETEPGADIDEASAED